ncbi:unnamed protein product [Blepharisma stoltei]|uniref:Uncharacterized protein n=1 Tax=Blepharisma stoltei TaxID=1481888 RepID=A0AAU9INH8_9CILI|nr:unnamed protein product [Blepharisma stoltei]
MHRVRLMQINLGKNLIVFQIKKAEKRVEWVFHANMNYKICTYIYLFKRELLWRKFSLLKQISFKSIEILFPISVTAS